jgi:hypothetical protein
VLGGFLRHAETTNQYKSIDWFTGACPMIFMGKSMVSDVSDEDFPD